MKVICHATPSQRKWKVSHVKTGVHHHCTTLKIGDVVTLPTGAPE